jgi:hypothetical protein
MAPPGIHPRGAIRLRAVALARPKVPSGDNRRGVCAGTTGRPHATELLLCGHHYHRSRRALAAAGATVLDPNRARVSPQYEIWVGRQA